MDESEKSSSDSGLNGEISLTEWKRGTPKIYRASWTSESVTYQYDATVVLPELEAFPVIQKEYQPLSEETVERAIAFFTENREPVSLRDHAAYKLMLSDLTDLWRIQSVVAEIYQYRIEQNVPDYMEKDITSLQFTLESFGDKLQEYQSTYLYYNDSDTPIWNPEDESLHVIHEDRIYSDSSAIQVNGTEMAFLNDSGYYDLLLISDESKDPLCPENLLHYYSFDPSKVQFGLLENECTFTRNQAIREAERIVEELGVTGLIPGEVHYLAGYYTVYFRGMDETLTCPNNMSEITPMPLKIASMTAAESSMYLMDCHDAYITLSQDHLQEVHLPVDRPFTTTVNTISFGEILNYTEAMKYYQEHFQLASSYASQENIVRDSTLFVDNIRLMNLYYLKEWKKEGENTVAVYESLPTWCFFGQADTGIDTTQEAIMSPFFGIPKGSVLLGTVLAYRDYDYAALGIDLQKDAIYLQCYPYKLIQSGQANYVIQNMEITNILRQAY